MAQIAVRMGPTEEWLPIDGFPAYEVSNLGAIRRRLAADRGVAKYWNAPKRYRLSGVGYPFVSLSRDGKKTSLHVHVIVCKAFNGPKPSPMHNVAHWDDDKMNYRADNLRWATQAENVADTKRNRGFFPQGRGKLTKESAATIKGLLAAGTAQHKIADLFGVSRTAISNISRGHTWRGLLL